MSVSIAPYPRFKAFTATGTPLAGGKLYTYDAGTTTLKNTYKDSTATTLNSNPVIFDSSGEADVWLNGYYKFVLHDSSDNPIWTKDNVSSSSAVVAPVTHYSADYTISDQGSLSISGSIANLINTIGSKNATITLPHSSGSTNTLYTVITNLSIPSNVKIEFEYGAQWNSGGGTLTINSGGSGWPITKTFNGFAAGGVLFTDTNPILIYPEWWGAKGDGATDNITAINCAIAARANSVYVQFGYGVYNFSSQILMSTTNKAGITLSGIANAHYSSKQGTRLHNINTTGGHGIFVQDDMRKCIKDMQITGNVNSGMGIVAKNTGFLRLENLMVGDDTPSGLGHGNHGIQLYYSGYYTSLHNVTSKNNYGRGLYITNDGGSTPGNNATWVTKSAFQNNALDGIFINNTYMVNFDMIDVSGNGGGRPGTTYGNISTSTAVNPTTITCSTGHNLVNGQSVRIHGNTTTGLNDTIVVATVLNSTQFTVPLLGGGTGGIVTGVAGYGIQLGANAKQITFKNVNFEVNGYGNKLMQDTNAPSMNYYEEFVGDNTQIHINSGTWTKVDGLIGNNSVITLDVNSSYCFVDRTDVNTTIFDLGTLNQIRSYKLAVQRNTNITLTNSDGIEYVEATSGITVTLPDCTSAVPLMRTISKGDATGTITISRGGTNTINGGTIVTMTGQYSSRSLLGVNGKWTVVSSVGA